MWILSSGGREGLVRTLKTNSWSARKLEFTTKPLWSDCVKISEPMMSPLINLRPAVMWPSIRETRTTLVSCEPHVEHTSSPTLVDVVDSWKHLFLGLFNCFLGSVKHSTCFSFSSMIDHNCVILQWRNISVLCFQSRWFCFKRGLKEKMFITKSSSEKKFKWKIHLLLQHQGQRHRFITTS